jgi:cytosine/adenosine deaminase-related metal-dependent hydrolase
VFGNLLIFQINMSEKPLKTYRSRWAMIDPDTWLQNATITISPYGQIDQCISNASDKTATDLGEGIIMPMLVNAHTHLELSALKGLIPMDMGFTAWVQHLVITRTITETNKLINAARDACQILWNSGVCAVGEISSLSLTKNLLIQSNLYGCWFREYFGNDCIPLDNITQAALSNCYFSLAGHAPHTTSPELFRYLKKAASGKPFSVHVSESDVEMEFITNARGEWADFLEYRDVDYLQWNLPQHSPVKHLEQIGILDQTTLLVHLLHFDSADLEIIKMCQCPVCVCPRSNYNLHQRLPDIEQMIHSGLTVCLGTDSLASVDSLSIWDEMKYLGKNFPNISPKDILAMATISGACALGHGKVLGRLADGYTGLLLYVPITGNSPEELANQLVHGEFSQHDIQIIRSNVHGNSTNDR